MVDKVNAGRKFDNAVKLPLDKLYAQFYSGEISRDTFEENVFSYIFTHLGNYHSHFKNKEECMDVICALYPRLSNAIDRYRMTGHSFDAYIASTINYALQTEYNRINRHQVVEISCWEAQKPEMEERGNILSTVEYTEQSPCKTVFNIKNDADKRQTLIILLKSYYSVKEEHIENVAKTTGIHSDYIYALIEKLSTMRAGSEKRVHRLIERIQTQYYRYISYETRLKNASEELRYSQLWKRRERARAVLSNMRRRLREMKITATNQQIADLLGIPKGTVDSCINSMHKRMKKIEQQQSTTRAG
ncbi:MAG: hypothetical protein LBG74_04895 [Spirochaetaceae bacterium]|jgi:hypothetical protein|nr:hypothetical protein [Spirochaetaceae bacterium]